MNVLSVVHSEYAGTELFGPLVVEAGHELDEWGFAWGTPPPRPLDAYDAVLIFGGGMHVDQEVEHPWLRDESKWLRTLLEGSVPVFGVCLGSQLIAQATGAEVGPLAAPEIGWTEVELTGEGAEDPVLSVLPIRFDAFHWHHYAHELPEGAVALARSAACLQAFRLGERCWGVQFHPEVIEPQLERLIVNERDPAPDPQRLLRQTRERIGRWNELGRRLCRAFLTAAESATP